MIAIKESRLKDKNNLIGSVSHSSIAGCNNLIFTTPRCEEEGVVVLSALVCLRALLCGNLPITVKQSGKHNLITLSVRGH